MKLLSYKHRERAGFGVMTPGGIVDLASGGYPDLSSALAAACDLSRLAAASDRVLSEDEIEWLPPIPAPGKLLCVGYNYRAHLIETNTQIPSRPSLFVRFPDAQVGHRQPIVRPWLSEQFDFEGELAVIIGREGRHIRPEHAMQYVAGYSCFADNSIRDFQRHTAQATAGKNFDRSGAFGPFLVTADEVPDPAALTLTTRVNGAIVQRSGLDDLIFPVPDLIAYASSFTTLRAGDVLATGTPGGVGMTRTPPLWLKNGDVLEVEITGIGTLRNPVLDERPEART